MREILFRGKRTATGEWVEGYFVHLTTYRGGNSNRIYSGYAEQDCGELYPDWWEVDPSTVGQFTGLADKNGRKIFEGDIISIEFKASEPPDGPGGVFFENAEVFFSAAYHGWYVRFSECSEERLWEYDNPSKVEVVGNCWDTPELLEGGLE